MRREGTPAWMQVVERRREQAAEESGGAVVNGWQVLADGALEGHPLSCHSRLPAGGNVLSKSLDAGLRRNDGRAGGWDVARHKSAGMTRTHKIRGLELIQEFSSRLRSIQAFFSWICMRCVSRSALGSSLAPSTSGKIERAVLTTVS